MPIDGETIDLLLKINDELNEAINTLKQDLCASTDHENIGLQQIPEQLVRWWSEKKAS